MADLVKVVNPAGEIGTIDPSDLGVALKTGYRMPTPGELHDLSMQEQYGPGAGNALKAAGLEAARTSTFGLSDVALGPHGLGFLTPEASEAYRKYHPVASTLGAVGSIGLGTGLLGGAEAATEGASVLNPIGALSKLGGRITEATAPLVSKIAPGLEGGLLNKIVSKGVSSGLGSATEAAGYGLGQSVSEYGLGDPNLNAEKVIANVGHAAFLGGGIGSGLGAALAPFARSEIAKAADNISNNAADSIPGVAQAQVGDSFEDVVNKSSLAPRDKVGLVDGLSKLKPNVKEIDDASERLGVPAFPGQRSDSEFVQNRYGMTTQSPSPWGVAEQQKIQSSLETINNKVGDAFGPRVDLSEAELGNALKKGFTDKLSAELDPISDIYENKLKPAFKEVPIDQSMLKTASNNIIKMQDLTNAEGNPLSSKSPQYQFAARVSEEINDLKSIDDLKRYRTLVRQDTYGVPALRHVSSVIQENLGKLESDSIIKFSGDSSLTKLRNEANARYSDLRDKMSDLGEIAGKRKIYGPKDLNDYITENITPEKLAKNVVRLAKTNSEGLSFIQKEFPEQFEQIKSYIKNDIRSDAMKNGSFNFNTAIKEAEKLSPESKKMFFNDKEIQTLKDANTWNKSWPKKWGPSGTPQGMMYLDFFQSPMKAAGSSVRDIANLAFANKLAGSNKQVMNTAALSWIERATQKTTNAVIKGSKAIFDSPNKVSPYIGYTSSRIAASEEHDKITAQLKDLSSNPEKFADYLQKAVGDLPEYAPSTSQAMQITSSRATSFLSSKIPGISSQLPLDEKPQISKSEISKFASYVEAVENPVSILKQVKSGIINPETMEAVKTVYPKLFQEMQSGVMSAMTSHLSKKNKIPYQTKLSVSYFLGQPLDSSMTGSSILSNQLIRAGHGAQQAQNAMENKAKSTQSGMSKLSIAESSMTPMQQVAQRKEA